MPVNLLHKSVFLVPTRLILVKLNNLIQLLLSKNAVLHNLITSFEYSHSENKNESE